MGSFFDWIMDFLYGLAAAALALLPNSPFATDSFMSGLSAFKDIMAQINYFVPFGQMLTLTSIYIGAVLIWYGVRWILRFARYIE